MLKESGKEQKELKKQNVAKKSIVVTVPAVEEPGVVGKTQEPTLVIKKSEKGKKQIGAKVTEEPGSATKKLRGVKESEEIGESKKAGEPRE